MALVHFAVHETKVICRSLHEYIDNSGKTRAERRIYGLSTVMEGIEQKVSLLL